MKRNYESPEVNVISLVSDEEWLMNPDIEPGVETSGVVDE